MAYTMEEAMKKKSEDENIPLAKRNRRKVQEAERARMQKHGHSVFDIQRSELKRSENLPGPKKTSKRSTRKKSGRKGGGG